MPSARYCTHLSRVKAEEATEFEDAVLVSIRDFGTSPPRLQQAAWQDVLMLEFDDVCCSDEGLGMLLGTGYVPPIEEHAEAIVHFSQKYFDHTIIAHCERGISRSAAVCWFLVEQGWRYVAAGEGLGAANQRLLQLMRRELRRIDGQLGQRAHV
jgi:predicted protein tyrosine phosphatase